MGTTMLHVRIDEETKAQAAEALASMGLSVSDAVRILLARVVSDQAFPLELKVPNAETRAVIKEARGLMASKSARFPEADRLFDELEETARR